MLRFLWSLVELIFLISPTTATLSGLQDLSFFSNIMTPYTIIFSPISFPWIEMTPERPNCWLFSSDSLPDNRTTGQNRPLFDDDHTVDNSIGSKITIFEMRPTHDTDVVANCAVFIQNSAFDMAVRSYAHKRQTLSG